MHIFYKQSKVYKQNYRKISRIFELIVYNLRVRNFQRKAIISSFRNLVSFLHLLFVVVYLGLWFITVCKAPKSHTTVSSHFQKSEFLVPKVLKLFIYYYCNIPYCDFIRVSLLIHKMQVLCSVSCST